MAILENKIDFAAIIRVRNANPNGDPLDGNRPRTNYDGYGEISDVCIKRKIRDRLLESGQPIFVQSDDRNVDGEPSLRARAESDIHGLGKGAFGKKASKEETAQAACKKWFDVRAFGQVFAFGKGDDASGVSIPIRGPVTVQSAFSVEPVRDKVSSIQITKSVNTETTETGKKGSDTMGMKHRIDRGIYVFYGSMNPQLAERTGFTDKDAEAIKAVLPRLVENDASSARPEGSMEILNVFWWKHNCKSGQYSSAKVHRTLKVNPDGGFEFERLTGLEPEIVKGF